MKISYKAKIVHRLQELSYILVFYRGTDTGEGEVISKDQYTLGEGVI